MDIVRPLARRGDRAGRLGARAQQDAGDEQGRLRNGGQIIPALKLSPDQQRGYLETDGDAPLGKALQKVRHAGVAGRRHDEFADGIA